MVFIVSTSRVVLSLCFCSVSVLFCSVLFGSDQAGKRQSLFIVCRWKDRVPCLAKELANQGSEQQISCRLPPCFYQISLLYVVLLLQRIAKFLAPTSTLAGEEYVKSNEICLGIGSYQWKKLHKSGNMEEGDNWFVVHYPGWQALSPGKTLVLETRELNNKSVVAFLHASTRSLFFM